MTNTLKELVCLGDTRRILQRLPVQVRQKMGRTLGLIQTGDTPTNVTFLVGFSASVQEIRIRSDKETYRAIYTVSLGDRVYLLHVFHKKSKSGIATPKRDVNLIQKRLREARLMEAERNG